MQPLSENAATALVRILFTMLIVAIGAMASITLIVFNIMLDLGWPLMAMITPFLSPAVVLVIALGLRWALTVTLEARIKDEGYERETVRRE